MVTTIIANSVNYILGVNLGKVKRWNTKRIAKIDPVTFPTRNVGWVEGVDAQGIFETIDITGTITGSFKTLQETITGIKNIADGFQIAGIAINSPFVNTLDKSGQLRSGILNRNDSTGAFTLRDSTVSFTAAGIQVGDVVKNLITGNAAIVVSEGVSATILTLDTDIFPEAEGTGFSYAVSATMLCKILNFDVNWQLPGITYVNYTLSIVQVAF